MKISVAVDAAGKILGFAHTEVHAKDPMPQAKGKKISSLKSDAALTTDDGQSVHAIELSPELERHYGKDAFADELFGHVVIKTGAAFSLVRAKK